MSRRNRWLLGGWLATLVGGALAVLILRGASPVAAPTQASALQRQQARASAPSPRAGAPLRILQLTASPLDVPMGGRSELVCEVEGGSGEPGARRYTWVASKGRVEGQGPAVSWVAPKTPGIHQVGVLVEEGGVAVRQTVTLHVHVPTPEDLSVLLRSREAVEAQEQAPAVHAAVEARLAALREVVARRETLEDRLRAFHALDELAAQLLDEGRYEEALRAYEELLGSLLETDPKRKRFQAGFASAAFALGREDEALKAFAEAGDYNHPMSFYYAGLLLEGRGQLAEALEAYRKAADANRWFADPLLRYARLLLQQGRPASEVIELLVRASPRFGREVLLERLASDAQLAPLNQALLASGRDVELEEQRPIETTLPSPPPEPAPGRNSTVVREN